MPDPTPGPLTPPGSPGSEAVGPDAGVPAGPERRGRQGRFAAELRHDLPRLLGGAAVLYGLLALGGLLLVRVVAGGWLVRADQRASGWFAGHRTGALNGWTHLGSSVSDTRAVPVVTLVLVVGLRLWLHRWRESMVILASICGELLIFFLVTATVHRERPAVPRLDPAPPTSSFPSGHTGAAVAMYVGFAVVLLRVSRGSVRRAARGSAVAAAVVLCAVPVLVALSRIYRGMHFPTDVAAGAVAGAAWLAVVVATLRPGGSSPVGRGRTVARPVPDTPAQPGELVTAGPGPGTSEPVVASAGPVRRLIVVSVSCLTGAAVLGVYVHGHLPAVDSWLHDLAVHHRRPVVGFARTVTQGGSTQVVWLLVAVAGLVFPRSRGTRRWVVSAAVILAGAAGIGVRLAASRVVVRPRPPRVDWASPAGGFAFPSGHTTSATLAAGLLAWALSRQLRGRRARAAVFLIAALYAATVGWSRVWLGVHWPLDVLGGWLLGVGWVAGMAALAHLLPWRGATAGRVDASAVAGWRGAGEPITSRRAATRRTRAARRTSASRVGQLRWAIRTTSKRPSWGRSPRRG